MANLSITTSQVQLISGNPIDGFAGEALTPGAAAYLKQSDGRWYLAQADGTAEEAGLYGLAIVLNQAAAAAQPIRLAGPGCVVNLGAGAAAVASIVYILSATAGSIAVVGDIVTSGFFRSVIAIGRGTNYVVVVGVAPGSAGAIP